MPESLHVMKCERRAVIIAIREVDLKKKKYVK